MEITAAIHYILTTAQSFGSQDCYNKSLIMILNLADVLLCENEQKFIKRIIINRSKKNTYVGCAGKIGEVSKQLQERE